MATRSRYPLEAARTLRADEESAARDALATQLHEQQRADESVVCTRDRLAAHDDETARVARLERAADDMGRSIGDALRAGEWQRRRRAEAATLNAEMNDAVRRSVEAAAASERARAALAGARAAREAVEKHHDAWLAGEKRTEEARADAEAEDLIAGRQPR